MLLDHGATVDIQNRQGSTSVHIGSREGDAEALSALDSVSYTRPNLLLCDHDGNTPVYLASGVKTATCLLEESHDPKRREMPSALNLRGETPLEFVQSHAQYLTRNEIKLKKFLELHVSLDPLTVDGAKFNLILTDVQLPLMYVTFLKVLC